MIFSLSFDREKHAWELDIECLDLYTEPKWDGETEREEEEWQQ